MAHQVREDATMSKGTEACRSYGVTRWSAPLALVAALALAPGIRAQPTTAFSLAFPSATLEAMKITFERGGVTWDVVRRNGLSLTVQGAGEFTISVAALAVNRGRILRTWKSPNRRQVSTGTVTLSGRDFIPDDRFLDGIPGMVGTQAGTTLSVADALRAIDSGSLSALLDRTTASSASGLILIALPEGTTSRTTTTNPRFARTETLSD
jgi:hypothetical protein